MGDRTRPLEGLMEITFRPIDQWPAGWRDSDRSEVRAPTLFRASYDDTVRLLREELTAIECTQAHIQLAITGAELRRDGQLRARAEVTHPGVILTAVTPERTLVLRTDRFYSRWYGEKDWQANLRAIALGLVDLRRMARYGLNDDEGAQYAGFAALGAGGPVALGTGMTRAEALECLRRYAGVDGGDSGSYLDLYRIAARHAHPDAGGTDEAMAEVNRARQVLEAHGG